MIVCIVLIRFLLTVLYESGNLDAIKPENLAHPIEPGKGQIYGWVRMENYFGKYCEN